MALPAPNLDDRRFQDLVDEAKRTVQRHCPEWTDHNVSDPGVTLIEVFAGMVDQLLYRVNRIPDRFYVKFLDLLGVHLLPPADAETEVTFWLSAPLPETLTIPVGTQVATLRTEGEPAISFSVTEAVDIVPCELGAVACSTEGRVVDQTHVLAGTAGFACFDVCPKPGDQLLIGLSSAVPRGAVVLRFACSIEGIGVDPTNPPLVWESWNGNGWSACALERDETGGLNRAGDVVLHIGADHAASVMAGQRAGWLRCRVIEAVEGQPQFAASPKVTRLSAFTIGGTAHVAHAEVVQEEVVGISEGVAGQRFLLQHRPVVAMYEPLVVEVSEAEGWSQWARVTTFADSGPSDRHFFVDPVAGAIEFGPAVRQPDGSLRQYGAIPAKGSHIRLPVYRSGGGTRGNVSRGRIIVLKSSIPYVTRVENRFPAVGGVEAEDIDTARVRGPVVLRSRNRAVTTEDYEQLAREAAPDVARVRCVAAGDDGVEAGGVRVLVVPAVGNEDSAPFPFDALVPDPDMLATVSDYLEDRRVIGTRVLVEPPAYQGFTVVARIRARPRVRSARLHADAVAALHRYFHPIFGGPERSGWPFGRPIHAGEVYSVLQALPGTEFVEDVRLFPADPVTGKRGEAVGRIDIAPNCLVFSYDPQVVVQGAS
jgi:predicted phage baseplate assembly protein